MNPTLLIDFYKVGHVSQYPKDTTRVWSNWTPRSSRVPGQTSVVHFGLQYFVLEVLQERFNRDFFGKTLNSVLQEYSEVIKACLHVAEPKTDHIAKLHRLGYLPLDIYSVPEGFSTPLNVPSVVVVNTLPEMFWLPNYIETMMSMSLWKPSTSATTAQRFRGICEKWAKKAGETDLGFVDYQCHDFSMRGMSGMGDVIQSGMGHLLSFSGTDSVPAILAAQNYYLADLSAGQSVAATEHSVMCAHGQDNEFELFKSLLTEIYPTGIVSVVSDTWDLWKILTDYIPRLKETILARDGKLILRPDSGDPVKILLGDPEAACPNARFGVLRLLAQALGTSNAEGKLGMINKAGAIYGDGINEERANAILGGCVEMGLSPYNVVFGVGSFAYEWVTRDTYGFAMKATAVERDGKVIAIFKDPITDDPNNPKKSRRGIPCVYKTAESPDTYPVYECRESLDPADLDKCAFRKVFSDGQLLIEEDFPTIQRRVRACHT